MHFERYPETIRQRLERDRLNIDSLLADPATDDLVWTRLPSGEFAWLRPEAGQVEDTNPAEPEDALFVVTDLGRRGIGVRKLGEC